MFWSQWSTSLKVVVVVAALLGVAGIAVLIWYLVDPDSFQSSSLAKIAVTSTDLKVSNGMYRALEQSRDVQVHADTTGVCGVPTATEWDTLLAQYIMDPDAAHVDYTAVRKCTVKRTDDFSDLRFDDKYTNDQEKTAYYKWIYGNMDSGTGDFHLYFIPRGANDIVVPLNNVHDDMHSLYLALTNDLWAGGFDPSSNEPDAIQTAFLSLTSPPPTSYQRLVGPAPGSAFGTEELYSFNALVPQAWSLANGALDQSKLSTLTAVTKDSAAPNLEGILRMAPRFINYDFTLNGKTYSMRVWINDSVVPMGTKSVCTNPEVTNLSQRIYAFVDITNFPDVEPSLLLTYPAASENKTILSFWNQPRSRNEVPEINEMLAAAFFGSFYSSNVQGLPLQVWNKEAVDFSQLGSRALTIDLKVDSSVSFREAKTTGAWRENEVMTEAFLEQNKAWMALLYDMPGLSFKAVLKFT
jgi:hypothetical protein